MPQRTRRALLAATPALLLPTLAHALPLTPRATEGPFYPVALPEDHDADLIRDEAGVRQAGGEVLHIVGRLVTAGEQPLPRGIVEIWQCDMAGVYLHPGSPGSFNPAFQGFGQVVTDADGAFFFRTLLPVPYTGRTPHIHLKAYVDGSDVLTTQFYLADHPQNAGDRLFNRMSADEQARQSMVLTARPDRTSGTYVTQIDVVVPG